MNTWAFAWRNVEYLNSLEMCPYENWVLAQETAEMVAEIEHAMKRGELDGIRQYVEVIYERWENTDDDDAMELLEDWHWIVKEALESLID